MFVLLPVGVKVAEVGMVQLQTGLVRHMDHVLQFAPPHHCHDFSILGLVAQVGIDGSQDVMSVLVSKDVHRGDLGWHPWAVSLY
jgi:hypothetical protein